MKSKSIYLVYSHEYNVGYVGKSCNLGNRFNNHCTNNRSSVRRYCDKHGIRPRDTFDIYEIKQCDAADDASYYEGHIYDLIERHLPDIKLINKNKPNRSPRDSRKNWRNNNLERNRACNIKYYHNNRECRCAYYQKWNADNRDYRNAYLKTWRTNNSNYHKQWTAQHPNYYKQYHMNKKQNK